MNTEILLPGMEQQTANELLELVKNIFVSNEDIVLLTRIARYIAHYRYWEAVECEATNRAEYWRVVQNCLDV